MEASAYRFSASFLLLELPPLIFLSNSFFGRPKDFFAFSRTVVNLGLDCFGAHEKVFHEANDYRDKLRTAADLDSFSVGCSSTSAAYGHRGGGRKRLWHRENFRILELITKDGECHPNLCQVCAAAFHVLESISYPRL